MGRNRSFHGYRNDDYQKPRETPDIFVNVEEPEVIPAEPETEAPVFAEEEVEPTEDSPQEAAKVDSDETNKAAKARLAMRVIAGDYGTDEDAIREGLELDGYSYDEVVAVRAAILDGTYYA